MTGPGQRLSVVDAVQTTDSYIRTAGREFLVTFYTALRSLKLYPLENAQVQKSLDDLARSAQQILEREQEIELRGTGEFLFVNSTRLRLDLDNYASFSHVLGVLNGAGVGLMRAQEGVDRREWTSFLSLLLATAARTTPGSRLLELQAFQAEITLGRNRKEIGCLREILVEGPALQMGWLQGLSDNYLRVIFPGPAAWRNRRLMVRLLSLQEDTVVGAAM